MPQTALGTALLASAWLLLGLTVVVAALRARHHPRARLLGRGATALLYIPAGAVVNSAFLLAGTDYSGFAAGSPSPFVRETWESLVVPHHDVFIGLLVAFELAVGVLVLVGGRATQVALLAAIGFHVALMSFGVGFWLWSVPMVAGFTLLLRAERRAQREARTFVQAQHPRSPVRA